MHRSEIIDKAIHLGKGGTRLYLKYYGTPLVLLLYQTAQEGFVSEDLNR